MVRETDGVFKEQSWETANDRLPSALVIGSPPIFWISGNKKALSVPIKKGLANGFSGADIQKSGPPMQKTG